MDIHTLPADILLIEDNPADANLFISAFHKSNPGKIIIWFDDGEQALKYILSDKLRKPEPGGGAKVPVMLDINMPKMNGFELMKKIKDSGKAGCVDFIVVSGSKKDSDLAQSYCNGAKTYMMKDIVSDNCLNMISPK